MENSGKQLMRRQTLFNRLTIIIAGMNEKMNDTKFQIQLLQQEIELQESNYKELIQQHPEYSELKSIREKIRELKKKLSELKEF